MFNSFAQWRGLRPLVEAAEHERGISIECGLRLNPEHSEGATPIYDPCSPGSRLGIRLREFEVEAAADPHFLDGISGSIATKKVVLASGVWTPGLGDMVGVKVPIRPRQGQILVTERLDGLVSKNYAEFGYLAAKSGKKRPGVTPEMEQFGVAMVLEPSAAGTVLIGSSRRFVGMDTTPHPAVMQAIAQRAKHFFPSFSGVKLIRAYAGVRPASPDGKPIISPTHVEGVYVAAGHEGNGIGLSLITGKLVSQMLRGETPLVDLAPLCIDRFGMNPPSLPSA